MPRFLFFAPLGQYGQRNQLLCDIREGFVVKIKFVIFCFLTLISCQTFAGMLNVGQGLSAGEVLYSNNGNYFATMQGDGNFVVYASSGHALWSTNTTGSGADWAVMQTDGNFVLYNKSQGRAVWSSNTAYNKPAYAAITDYGQWIVFRVDPVWSSNTSDHSNPVGANAQIFGGNLYLEQGKPYSAGQYSLTFQFDGNLVLYSPLGATWSSGTTGKGKSVYIQSGSILINPNPTAPALWSVPSNPEPVFRPYSISEQRSGYLALQADGNLVMYIPKRAFATPSPYAPAEIYQSNGPGCYGPPDACFGSTLPIYKYTW